MNVLFLLNFSKLFCHKLHCNETMNNLGNNYAYKRHIIVNAMLPIY